MQKILIGSIVGAVILFVWSFLSWAILPLHLHTYMYSPVQDTVLSILKDHNLETGVYSFPMADNRNVSGFDAKFREESEKVMKENTGKPMATVFYEKEGYDMSSMTMVRGFLFNFLAVLAVCILLAPAFTTIDSFFGRWWLTLIVGLLINASGPLIQFNWMGVPWEFTLDMIVDNFLNWGITGLWLAWFLKKG